MKNTIINLINSSHDNEHDKKSLESIFILYEQLQYSTDLEQMSEDIYAWLNKSFHVDNVTISLFDIQTQQKENIYIKGEEFYLDDSKALFFIINTHTDQNAIVSFNATSKTHYEILQTNYSTIESAFFLISPIVQSRILKKNFIQTQSIDSVTNVYNRQYLTKHVNKLISLTGKSYNKIHFLMISIDRFKAIIDEFDYDAGDKVLVELARVIHSNIKENDVVARLTGDEFLVSIVSTSDDHGIENIAQKIIELFALSKIVVNEQTGQTLQKTVCIGTDCFITDGEQTLDDTIKNADIALYEAKNLGRSKFKNFRQISDEDTIDLF